jgi:hypothetical protein
MALGQVRVETDGLLYHPGCGVAKRPGPPPTGPLMTSLQFDALNDWVTAKIEMALDALEHDGQVSRGSTNAEGIARDVLHRMLTGEPAP